MSNTNETLHIPARVQSAEWYQGRAEGIRETATKTRQASVHCLAVASELESAAEHLTLLAASRTELQSRVDICQEIGDRLCEDRDALRKAKERAELRLSNLETVTEDRKRELLGVAEVLHKHRVQLRSMWLPDTVGPLLEELDTLRKRVAELEAKS